MNMIPMLLLLAFATPAFESFPAGEIFKGKPAAPKLKFERHRRFQTKIVEGAAKGPNFAGHYTIVEWGCGASCISPLIVDAKTGVVYPLPFEVLSFGFPYRFTDEAGGIEELGTLSYRLDSNLLVVRGCPEERDCATYSYEWQSTKLRQIDKIPARRVPGARVVGQADSRP